MVERLRPELCVIGAGPGGVAAATAAAALGASVVLVEQAADGGSPLRHGSVPAKALLAAARQAECARRGAAFGVTVPASSVDFGRLHRHVRDVAGAVAPLGSTTRLAGLGIRTVSGPGRFSDRATVVAGEVEIAARWFVVATGSGPARPPIPGLAEVEHFTTETIFDLAECPEHLVVIGADSVAVEIAQAFRRLGAAVTVVHAGVPLPYDDPECAAIVIDQLLRDGVVFRHGLEFMRVEPADYPRVKVILKSDGREDAVEATHLLLAAGRRPNLDGLNLEAARIRHDASGILVDRYLKTTNKRVYAIGDVIGSYHYAHAAADHGLLVVRHAMFGERMPVASRVVPWAIHTDPELAHVGLSEIEARARAGAVNVLRWPYHENVRAQAERITRGHVKVVTTRGGRILGATIVGAQASEMITLFTLAIAQQLNVRALAGLIVPHPTLSEIAKRAAMSFFALGLAKPKTRRLIAWLRRFG